MTLCVFSYRAWECRWFSKLGQYLHWGKIPKMITRSVFSLDCTAIIPACEFNCAKCLMEIQSVLGKMQGVDKAYTQGQGKDTKLIVEHDASNATVKYLMQTFGCLPSFYEGFFVSELLEV